MQTATSETERKSLDLSICVHHYTLRAPCPKGQGMRDLHSLPFHYRSWAMRTELGDQQYNKKTVLHSTTQYIQYRTVLHCISSVPYSAYRPIDFDWTNNRRPRHGLRASLAVAPPLSLVSAPAR